LTENQFPRDAEVQFCGKVRVWVVMKPMAAGRKCTAVLVQIIQGSASEIVRDLDELGF
jgi:hypothetical protein